MSSSDIGGISVSSLARFRADATLRVDSATGHVRVTDRENPFRRVITWVRDALGLRSRDAVETEKGEIRAAYNRFFKSIAQDLRYRELAPALQETLAARITGNNPKPLTVRAARKIMADLERSAARSAGPGAPAGPAAAGAGAPVAAQGQEETPAATVPAQPPAVDREQSMPDTPAPGPDRPREQPAPVAAGEVGRTHEAARTGARPRRWSMPAGHIDHGDELKHLEWDHAAEYSDPDQDLEVEANLVIAEIDPGFLAREQARQQAIKSGRAGGDDHADTPAMAGPDADPEPGSSAGGAAGTDTGAPADPYQTVFIDEPDEEQAAPPDAGVEAVVQRRLQAIAARLRDNELAAADALVEAESSRLLETEGASGYDKLLEAQERRNSLAVALEKQIHPGNSEVVQAGMDEVYAEVEQLEIEAMATDKETSAWQRLRARFLQLEQELHELERLQQA